MKRLALLLPLLAFAAAPARAEDPATNALPVCAKQLQPANPEREKTMNPTTEHTDCTPPATPDPIIRPADPAGDNGSPPGVASRAPAPQRRDSAQDEDSGRQ